MYRHIASVNINTPLMIRQYWQVTTRGERYDNRCLVRSPEGVYCFNASSGNVRYSAISWEEQAWQMSMATRIWYIRKNPWTWVTKGIPVSKSSIKLQSSFLSNESSMLFLQNRWISGAYRSEINLISLHNHALSLDNVHTMAMKMNIYDTKKHYH